MLCQFFPRRIARIYSPIDRPYTYAGPAFVRDAAPNTVGALGVVVAAACIMPASPEFGFDARTACASLIACCATAVALSRIDCGNEGFELTSVSNERAVCRRTTAEAKDIHLENDPYKSSPKVYHCTSFKFTSLALLPFCMSGLIHLNFYLQNLHLAKGTKLRFGNFELHHTLQLGWKQTRRLQKGDAFVMVQASEQ